MPFKGITFAGQNVTPKNDGGLYQAHHGDGILWGCSMNISGDDLVIQSGEFIMGGRVVQVDGATSVDLSGRTLQTGYIQVIMNADLTQGEGQQWYPTFVESATTTFPTLTQDDINDTGTLYQLELAVVQISGGNLTAIISEVTNSPLEFISSTGKKGQITQDESGGQIDYQVLDGNGDVIGGLFPHSNGNTYLYGGGTSIQLRPNGKTNSNGAVQVLANGDTSIAGALSVVGAESIGGDLTIGGQTHGGITVKSKSGTMSSLASGTVGTLVTETGLSNAGRYLVIGYTNFSAQSSGGSNVYLSLEVDGTTTDYVSGYTGTTSRQHKKLIAYVAGASTMKLQIQAGVGLSNLNANLTIIQIA